MIYWYTGQPGHGKTLHAIDHGLRFRDEGRLVYVGNVTEFDYQKARMLPITPEQFRDWMNFLPDGAVCLIDEAYEHDMLPKRPPGAKVPPHVEQLAKHRHRGLDFIFVSQSPATQCDAFVHDLVEQHIHVRRMWGLPFVWLRKFFYLERNPLKAHPNVISRVRLPRRPMGLYKSTAMDTTQKHVPWYVILLAILLPTLAVGGWLTMRNVESSLHGVTDEQQPAAPQAEAAGKNGAIATVAPVASVQQASRDLRATDFAAWLTPRVPSQPWSAPAYDSLSVAPRAPRVFCMEWGEFPDNDCHCLTEQGTRYMLDLDVCMTIARDGQYEPFLDEVRGDLKRMDDTQQLRNLREQAESQQLAPLPVVPIVDWEPME